MMAQVWRRSASVLDQTRPACTEALVVDPALGRAERLVQHGRGEVEALGRLHAAAERAEDPLRLLLARGGRRKHGHGPAVLGDGETRDLARGDLVQEVQTLRLELARGELEVAGHGGAFRSGPVACAYFF